MPKKVVKRLARRLRRKSLALGSNLKNQNFSVRYKKKKKWTAKRVAKEGAGFAAAGALGTGVLVGGVYATKSRRKKKRKRRM